MSESEQKIALETKRLENVKKKYSDWKESFFSIMNDLYKQPADVKSGDSIRVGAFYGLNTLIFFNTAAILLNHNASISNWQNFRTLWLIIEFSRLDVVCSEFGALDICIISAYSFYFAIFSLFAILFLSRKFLKMSFMPLVSILSKFLILATIANFGLFILLALTLKYSWTHEIPTEYDETTTSLDQSTLGVVLSGFAMLLIIVIGYCGTVFDYDCRHSFASSSLRAKAYSKIELNSLFCNYFSILLYVFVDSASFIGYRVAMMIIHAVMAVMYCYYLPYYRFQSNFIRSSCNVFAVTTSFLMIIAYSIDNAIFCLYGIFIVAPLVFLLWYSAFNYRISKIREGYIELISDIWEFELMIRQNLIDCDGDQEKEKEILDKFHVFLSKNSCKKTKQLFLWEINFIYYSCHYERVAFYKLSGTPDIGESLEEEYQEYRLRKNITAKIRENFEEYKFTTKIYQYDKVKKRDREACILTFKYWANITSKKSTLTTFENDGELLKECLDKLKREYSSLIEQFPTSITILELYSSFMISFYNDPEDYALANARKESLLNIKKKERKHNPIFDEANPLFLVSASSSNIGKIIYCNAKMSEFLQMKPGTCINNPISAYFPEEYNCFTAKALKRFKNTLHTTTTYIDEPMLLLTSQGLLVETNLVMILLGSINPLFIVICLPNTNTRAVAIISPQGIFLHHSENLLSMLGIQFKLQGLSIDQISHMNLEFLKSKKKLKISFNNSVIIVEYIKHRVRGNKLRILNFYATEESFVEESANEVLHLDGAASRRVSFIDNDTQAHTTVAHSEATAILTEKPGVLEVKTDINTSATSSTSNPFLTRMSSYSEQSLRALKYLKGVLLLSVSHI